MELTQITMSIEARMQLTLEPNSNDWQFQVIDALTRAGWNLDDHGRIMILPLGDDDDFEWTEHDPRNGSVRSVLRSKISAGEPLGITLTWKETQSGGTLTIHQSGRLDFSASINRQCLQSSQASDVSWYLPKIVNAIVDTSIYVSSWGWTEIH